ncbi:unnamed protein product [Sphenostylis stenocarpa]|uniref:Uncharacterized protein n=1 Tax=Sphenostylis stenocarpa TaxID=92480 RepID=A0AA86TDB2_9FABA|nr:unnamed protein product [Sphenostylis stenocarpa]
MLISYHEVSEDCFDHCVCLGLLLWVQVLLVEEELVQYKKGTHILQHDYHQSRLHWETFEPDK